MSYCRWGWDGSHVYVITTTTGLECVGCCLHEYVDKSDPNAKGWAALRGIMTKVPDDIEDRFNGPDANEKMIEHLERHQAHGDHVPEYVFTQLRDPKDAEENQAHWAKYRKGVT